VIRAYCTCGDKADISINPPEQEHEVYQLWLSLHQGEGHLPCDAETARKARHRNERRA
jgi:hypothetical protein